MFLVLFCNLFLRVFRGNIAEIFQEYETILFIHFLSKLKILFYTLGSRMSRNMCQLCVKIITFSYKSFQYSPSSSQTYNYSLVIEWKPLIVLLKRSPHKSSLFSRESISKMPGGCQLLWVVMVVENVPQSYVMKGK